MIRLTTILALAACPAMAQQPPPCAPRAAVVGQLAAQFQEAQQNYRIDINGNLLETFADPVSGTWTDIKTAPGGMSCMVGSGQGFQASIPTPQGSPA